MYCTNGIVTKPAHPALEGSICGQQRVCFAGKCRPEQDLINHMILFGIHPTQTGGGKGTENVSYLLYIFSDKHSALFDSSYRVDIKRYMVIPGQKPTTTTTAKPPITVPEGNATQNCTCDYTPQLPPSLHNLPKSICMFLAPVFHPLFNCSVQCPSYILHVDLDTDNVTEEALSYSNLPVGGSCYLGSYTVIQEKVGDDVRVPLRDAQVCGAIPHVMHPTLQCPSVGGSGASGAESCPPENIILTLQNNSYTYIHNHKGEGDEGQSLLWKGERYSLLSRTGEDDTAAREVFASMTDATENISKYGFIKCNLQDGFPEELKNLPKEICNFLPLVLHDLFGCSPEPQCSKYVMFMNLDDGNTTKVPVKVPSELLPPCEKCLSEMAVSAATIWDILKGVTSVLTQATGLCKLLPTSWLAWIPGCSASPSLEYVFKNCPPVSIVIKAGGAVFVYHPRTGHRAVTDGHPSIEWQKEHYILDKISYDGNPTEILRENYDLDFRYQIVSQTQPNDLATALKVGRPKEKQVGDATTEVTEHDAEISVGLQEYVAQKDVFLALNAPAVSLSFFPLILILANLDNSIVSFIRFR